MPGWKPPTAGPWITGVAWRATPAGMERAEIFIAETEIDIQSARNLPRVLSEEIEAVHGDVPFRISYGDAGALHVAGEKVSERFGGGKYGRIPA